MQSSRALNQSTSSTTTKKEKPHKKSVVHRLLERWVKTHRGVVEDKTQSLKKPSSSKSIRRHVPMKLILLGTENSGKSAIAKQMKIVYQGGFTPEEKKAELLNIQSYILGSLKDILQGVDKLNLTLPQEIQKIATYISSLPKTHPWTPELVAGMKTLVLDSVVSKFLLKCAELQLYDNFSSLLSKLDTFCSVDSVPANEDILRIHTRTTGVTEYSLKANELDCRVLDLGGCKSEQRRWLFFFENVNAVFYVVALNEYDMQCREDPNTNRMQDSLRLFSHLVNNFHFRNTPIILLFNKTDLFQQKLQRRPLTVCFPEYSGGLNYSAAIQFIENKFKMLDASAERKILTYMTCATGDIQDVFTDALHHLSC